MRSDIPIVGLDVDVRHEAERVEVVVAGELDIASCGVLLDRLDDIDAAHDVVLDLKDLTFMDSSGLRCLWSVRERTHSLGGDFVLRAPSAPVLRVLEAMEVIGEFVVEAG